MKQLFIIYILFITLFHATGYANVREDMLTQNYKCANLTGFYSGRYRDTGDLFPATAFPISLYLDYKNDMLYGYTLPAEDAEGAKYGLMPYALIWAKCHDGKISNWYIIKNSNRLCGSPWQKTKPVLNNGFLHLQFSFETAMINTIFSVQLQSVNPKNAGGKINLPVLKQAIAASKKNIPSCH